MNIEEDELHTDMGSNLSRRRNRRQSDRSTSTSTLSDPTPNLEASPQAPLHIQDDDDIPLEEVPPLMSPPNTESLDTVELPLTPTSDPSPPSGTSQGIGMIISSGDSNRSESQPALRLSIIYFVPYRRNGRTDNDPGSNPPLEEMLNGDTPFNPEMLGRVLFAMTIPLSGGTNGNPFQLSSFEDILDHLMRQHVPQGPPPTSKAALDKLPLLPVTEKLLEERCLVCQENFALEESALRLPCDHHFHKDCVMSWLESHCTCPTCRYELPVDDKEYDAERKKRMAGRGIVEEVEEEPQPMEIEEELDQPDEDCFDEVPYESLAYDDMFEDDMEEDEVDDGSMLPGIPAEERPLLSSPRCNDQHRNKFSTAQHTANDEGLETVHA